MADIQATAQDHTELELLLRGFMVPRMLPQVTDFGFADCIPPEG